MNTLIQLLDKNYELYDCRIKESNIIMEIGSKTNRFFCPYCGQPSDRVHSCYQREIQDLPIQGKRTILLVTTRKLFCDNPECQKKSFSERHPFVSIKGKKTARLENAILNKSLDVSSISASKVSAKYSYGFPNTLVSSIIVGERYLDDFTTITEDRLWQLPAKPVFRWRNRSGLSRNAAKAA